MNLTELNKIADWYATNKPNEISRVTVNMSASELGRLIGKPYTKDTKDFIYKNVVLVVGKR